MRRHATRVAGAVGRCDIRTNIAYVQGLEGRLEELRTAADQADAEYRAEIARLRLTDEEREAVEAAVRIVESREAMEEFTADSAATLRGLLERLGGER